MERRSPSWDPDELLDGSAGLRVLAFHPIHIYLNSASNEPYQALKTHVSSGGQWCPQIVDEHVNEGEGAGTILAGVIDRLAAGGGARVRDVHARWASA